MSTIINKQISVFVGVVIKDETVLLVERSEKECKEAHMKWELPGGKVDFGETPEEAVVREIQEETGVLVGVKKLIPFVKTVYWEYEWGHQQTLVFAFVCDFTKQEEGKEDHHVRQFKWTPLSEVKNLKTLPGVVDFIDFAIKK